MNPEYSELLYMLKKCRAVLNMAGYYDMVVAIDKLLDEYGVNTKNTFNTEPK